MTTSAAGRSGWRRSLPRWWPWALGAVVCAAVAAAGWLFGFSSVFAVRTVEVVGEDQVSAQQVIAAAEVDTGAPLLRVDTGAIADRVRGLDAVARAEVTRVWPHTLRISVVERRPLGVIRTDDGYGVLGSDGVVYRTVAGPQPHLPFLDQHDGDAATSPAAAAAVQVVVDLPRSLSRRVATVTATSPDRVELTLRGGQTVAWGTADASARKAQVLLLLLPHHARHYDVSAPEAPVTVG